GGEQKKLVLVGQTIDLVEHQHLQAARVAEPPEDALDILVHALYGVDEQNDDVGVESPSPRRLHHGAVEPPSWPEDARRVEKDELARAVDDDTAHGNARGLHLARNDRHL